MANKNVYCVSFTLVTGYSSRELSRNHRIYIQAKDALDAVDVVRAALIDKPVNPGWYGGVNPFEGGIIVKDLKFIDIRMLCELNTVTT